MNCFGFDEMAELLEFRGENPFRIRAYRNGAKAIRELEEPVTTILNDLRERNLINFDRRKILIRDMDKLC